MDDEGGGGGIVWGLIALLAAVGGVFYYTTTLARPTLVVVMTAKAKPLPVPPPKVKPLPVLTPEEKAEREKLMASDSHWKNGVASGKVPEKVVEAVRAHINKGQKKIPGKVWDKMKWFNASEKMFFKDPPVVYEWINKGALLKNNKDKDQKHWFITLPPGSKGHMIVVSDLGIVLAIMKYGWYGP